MALGELIERIEKLDDYQVRFVLRHPEAPFLADLAMGFASIYSAEYAAQLLAAGTPEKLNSEPIGTGPFIFERYAKDAQIRFRGNPDYWDGAPPMDRLIFAITPDPNVRQQKLKAGDCQIAVYPRPTDIAQLKSEPDLKVLELDSLMVAYIALNVRHPPLDDPRVRQAINLAMYKPAYLRAQFGEGLAFAERGGQAERALEADFRRHGGIGEGVDRLETDGAEHFGHIGGRRAGVAAFKRVERGEEIAGRSHSGTLGWGPGLATEFWVMPRRISETAHTHCGG